MAELINVDRYVISVGNDGLVELMVTDLDVFYHEREVVFSLTYIDAIIIAGELARAAVDVHDSIAHESKPDSESKHEQQ